MLPGWMYCADPPEVPVAPTSVKTLNVIPSDVYVTPGATLVLRARMLDEDNGVLPSDPALTWSLATGLTKVTAAGDSIVVHAQSVTPGSSATVQAQVGAGNPTATATLRVIAANPAGTSDVVLADSRPVAPDVVLVDGNTTAGPTNDSLVAFVQTGLLGDWTGTGELIRLSTDRIFERRSVTWLTGRKDVDLKRSGAPQTPLQASMTVLDATTLGASDRVQDDAAYAVTVFGRQRTGVTFNHVVNVASLSGSYYLEYGTNFECVSVVAKLQALGVASGVLAADHLTIVYVDDILDQSQPGQDPTSAGLRGYACPHDATAGAVVLISRLLRSSTTLTHELGHALGLIEPVWGHTRNLPGFSYTNMMWSGESDERTGARSTFSLGQAFRINVDDHSWLFQKGLPTWPPRDCSDDLTVSLPCPALARDVEKLPE